MPSLSKDYGEKRNFIRMFVNANVSITDKSTGQTFEGTSKDLSGDGVSIVTNKDFQLNQELELHIRSAKGTLSPLTAVLTVRRSSKLDDGMYEVAGSIESVS